MTSKKSNARKGIKTVSVLNETLAHARVQKEQRP